MHGTKTNSALCCQPVTTERVIHTDGVIRPQWSDSQRPESSSSTRTMCCTFSIKDSSVSFSAVLNWLPVTQLSWWVTGACKHAEARKNNLTSLNGFGPEPHGLWTPYPQSSQQRSGSGFWGVSPAAGFTPRVLVVLWQWRREGNLITPPVTNWGWDQFC